MPAIATSTRHNFKTLQRAFRMGDVDIMDVWDARLGKSVAAIVAVTVDKDGTHTMTPFATMLDGDPFATLFPPSPDGPGYVKPDGTPVTPF